MLIPIQGNDLTAQDKSVFRAAVQQGLNFKYKVYSGSDVDKKLKKFAVVTCDETKCLQKVGVAFQTSLIARGMVVKKQGGYLLTVEIKDVFGDEVIYSQVDVCRNCDEFDAIERLRLLANGTSQETTSLPTQKQAQTNPPTTKNTEKSPQKQTQQKPPIVSKKTLPIKEPPQQKKNKTQQTKGLNYLGFRWIPRASVGSAFYSLYFPKKKILDEMSNLPGYQMRINDHTLTVRENSFIPEQQYNFVAPLFAIGLKITSESFYMDFFIQGMGGVQDSDTITIPILPEIGDSLFSPLISKIDANLPVINSVSITSDISVVMTDINGRIGYKISTGSIFMGFKSHSLFGEYAKGGKIDLLSLGPVTGAEYGFKLFDWGTLSFSTTYFLQNGTIQLMNFSYFPQFELEASSRVEGLNFTMTWQSNLTNTIDYNLSLNVETYTHKDIFNVSDQTGLSDNINISFSSLQLSLMY